MPSGARHTSFGPLKYFPAMPFASTVIVLSGAIDHSSFFSSAQAMRLPDTVMNIPFARPAGCMNVESFPSVLHRRIRSFG